MVIPKLKKGDWIHFSGDSAENAVGRIVGFSEHVGGSTPVVQFYKSPTRCG